MTTSVRVLYFGGLKEALGCAAEVVDLDASAPSLNDLYDALRQRHERLPGLTHSVRVALNEEFLPGTGAQVLSWSGFIRDGDVVAFIPPVTGG